MLIISCLSVLGNKREAQHLTGMRIRLSLLCPDVKFWGTVVHSHHAILHNSMFDYSVDRRHCWRTALLQVAVTCCVEHAIINQKRRLGPFGHRVHSVDIRRCYEQKAVNET